MLITGSGAKSLQGDKSCRHLNDAFPAVNEFADTNIFKVPEPILANLRVTKPEAPIDISHSHGLSPPCCKNETWRSNSIACSTVLNRRALPILRCTGRKSAENFP